MVARKEGLSFLQLQERPLAASWASKWLHGPANLDPATETAKSEDEDKDDEDGRGGKRELASSCNGIKTTVVNVVG